ncbi:hypothetical protein ADK67_35855 [Saccharothrix sp. NRRL B-16348]|nr:hypothetical protein ADK67_35855 [Saccharothrix sp. NRRL B-16348]
MLWLGQLPAHPAVRSAHREDAPEPDADLLTVAEPAHEVTIVIVTHNMQQAARVSQQCAFFLAEQGTPGVIVEAGPTKTIFDAPSDSRTSDYVHGRFG